MIGALEVWHVAELLLGGCCRRVHSGYIGGPLRCPDIQAMIASGALERGLQKPGACSHAHWGEGGALGMPFVPTRSFLGTDFVERAHQPPGVFRAQAAARNGVALRWPPAGAVAGGPA